MGASFAYYATPIGVFVTSLYSFRLYFLVFHGKERFDTSGHGHGHGHDDHGHDDHGHHGGTPHESPWVVTLPLLLLAIPGADRRLGRGSHAVRQVLRRRDQVLPQHPAMHELHEEWHGWVAFGMHAFQTPPFWLVVAGAVIAWYCYPINPKVPAAIKSSLSGEQDPREQVLRGLDQRADHRARCLPAAACGRPVTAA